MPGDDTVLCANMVLTLEPSMATRDGRLMVHEENIVITADGCRFLSPRIGAFLPEI
jgi:Xaa-Pro aminopeptidase